MKLRFKLPLIVATALLMTMTAGLFGIYRLNQSVDTYASVIEVDYGRDRLAAQLLVDFKTQVQEWKNTLLRGKDPKQLDKYWVAFGKHEKQVSESASRLQTSLPEGEVRSLVDQFVKAHATMGEGYRKGYEAFKTADFDAAVGDAAVKGKDRAPAELLEQVSEKIVAGTAVAVAEAGAASRRATVLSLVLMLAVSALGIGGAIFVSRSVTRAIDEARRVAETVAAGDLSSRIEVTRSDEIGQLLVALKAMNDNLVKVVGTVRASSDSIATGSAQIATGNADLSQRTEEQAANLQQTAASMEQISATVRSGSETAREAAQLAASASAVAARGGQAVEQVVTTMADISASSKKVVDIIAVIDGIAFQTNILALNAAVEAARAGEQGRGFAVVAGEVRTLAQRSAEAAKEIKNLIGASAAKVDDGTRLVGNAGTTMAEIVAQIQRVSTLIGEISSGSAEQTTGVGQISDAVGQLDQVTQQNAALVEESAAAAESLKHQAARLVDAVSVFKLATQS
ncbi:methyl-accepting chemotaxis protein [Methylibium sp.]|uniref:methyl-accepting chemotaxis protein n=1 Tax=Methylibium sp. TaxID=2067992 RepID=UPI00333EADB7